MPIVGHRLCRATSCWLRATSATVASSSPALERNSTRFPARCVGGKTVRRTLLSG